MPNESPVVFHQRLKLWLSFYHKRVSKVIWEVIWTSLWKYRKVQNLLCSIRTKVTKIDKDGKESVVTISYKIKCVDSVRFITTSLSNLIHNLTEGIRNIQCKDCDCFLEYKSVLHI